MRKKAITYTLVFSIFLGGCTVGTNYTEPNIELPARYVDGGAKELSDASRLIWWQSFGDPVLNELVMRGLDQNIDIQTAVQRIETARAAVGLTGVAAQVNGGVSLESRRIERTDGSTVTASNSTADANFVFDLFGEFTRARQGAIANLEAVQFDSGSVRLAVIAEIIDAYNAARFFQESAAITRASIRSRRQVLDLVQRRATAEDATALEIAQTKALLATAEANLPILLGRYEESIFRIATLVVQPGSDILARMNAGRAQLRPRGNLEVGVPADVLRNRPDVRRAEREFARATASAGVAEAQLLPSLSLDGTVTVGDLDSWSFGPTLFLPLFNRAVLSANRDVALSRAEEAELLWRSVVLNAVEDVQSAQALVRRSAQQVAAFRRAVSASNDVLDLSQRSYDVGAATLLDIIDAEERVFDNRLALASAIRTWTSSYVQLQVGAGKGWLVGAKKVYIVKRENDENTFGFMNSEMASRR